MRSKVKVKWDQRHLQPSRRDFEGESEQIAWQQVHDNDDNDGNDDDDGRKWMRGEPQQAQEQADLRHKVTKVTKRWTKEAAEEDERPKKQDGDLKVRLA